MDSKKKKPSQLARKQANSDMRRDKEVTIPTSYVFINPKRLFSDEDMLTDRDMDRLTSASTI